MLYWLLYFCCLLLNLWCYLLRCLILESLIEIKLLWWCLILLLSFIYKSFLHFNLGKGVWKRNIINAQIKNLPGLHYRNCVLTYCKRVDKTTFKSLWFVDLEPIFVKTLAAWEFRWQKLNCALLLLIQFESPFKMLLWHFE